MDRAIKRRPLLVRHENMIANQSVIITLLVLGIVNGQGHMPWGKLRKAAPAMDGQSNDVYAEMERSKHASVLPGGMAVLYASAPIFSPRASKDPEGAAEVYRILPRHEAVHQGVKDRRLLEDALIEMGFPLEELTGFDETNGRVMKINSKTANSDGLVTEDTTELPEDADAEAILAALAGPLPYIRRGAWGRK